MHIDTILEELTSFIFEYLEEVAFQQGALEKCIL